MKPVEILQNALVEGVKVSKNGAEKIKIAGDEKAVEKWLPQIRANKDALLKILSSEQNLLSITPAACRNCNQLEILSIAGRPVPGCAYELEHGPWWEEWHRLPADLHKCIFH